jgi:hypothetical protein
MALPVLRANTGSNPVIVLLAIAVRAIVLIVFAIDTLQNSPETFTPMLAVGVLAVVLDAVWRAKRPAATRPAVDAEASPG